MVQPSFYTKIESLIDSYGKFVISPLPFGFGHSLGNALRRTLLSSLKGTAVIQVKIDGAPHMFSTLDGVKESVLEIILNLKQLKFKAEKEGEYMLHLEATGKGKLYGKDLKGEIEVVNKDLYIAELTSPKAKLDINVLAKKSLGKLESQEQEKKEFGYIPVDAYFSPVKKVNYIIKEARVGSKSNFDKLILEIFTDGSIKPDKALRNSSQLLVGFFAHLLSGKDVKEEENSDSGAKEQEEMEKKLNNIIIDELNLPSRVINALLRAKIETVADLIKVGKDELVGFKGVGKKSLSLIEKELLRLKIEF